jgi:hypothetical protein
MMISTEFPLYAVTKCHFPTIYSVDTDEKNVPKRKKNMGKSLGGRDTRACTE